MSDKSASEANYEIGYGKPPKATQFKKGKSGNPKGRNRGEQIEDVRVVIEEVLEETLPLREDGRVRTVTKLEAMMRAQFVDALRGNPKAVRTIFKLAKKTGLFSRAKPKGCLVIDPAGTEEQRFLLRAFHAEHPHNSSADPDPLNVIHGQSRQTKVTTKEASDVSRQHSGS
jgi:hypothetical protein